ncbi:MAG: hypothetical protein HYS34_00335 [Acidobacteria bacterium]|nr:hypothetical protein [Acidobacteriota bacterium]
MTLPPPDSGRRFASLSAAAAALLLALLLPACGGDDRPENRIKPIQATLAIDLFQNAPDPAVYFLKDPKDARFPDLETVQVRLYTTGPVNFDAYTLEIHFDPTVVQIGDVFEFNPGLLGGCFGGTTCEPFCLVNTSQANATGTLLVGVSKRPDAFCPPASIATDTMLLRIGFIAQSTIAPPGSRIEIIEGPGDGDCEILNNLVEDPTVDCVDGNASMTATR